MFPPYLAIFGQRFTSETVSKEDKRIKYEARDLYKDIGVDGKVKSKERR
jgi:hypothetical protein